MKSKHPAEFRPLVSALLAVASIVSLGGCTIAALRDDVSKREVAVDEKEHELASLKQASAELNAEREQLMADLQQRELSAKELRTRLNTLVGRGGSGARQLQEMSDRAQGIENATMSEDEKRRRLEQLREETRQLLEVLLAG